VTQCSRDRATAEAYDAIATRYADTFRDALDGLPLDRAVLAAFAELSSNAAEKGLVADVGCGPGRITMQLRSLGLNVFGVDLSPAMIELARNAHPGLRFEVGSMESLDVADAALRGIVSWYSMIHVPPQDVSAVLGEFQRVLAPGGYLLLAFFESDGEPVAAFDHKVITAFRWPIDILAALAGDAGFLEVGRMLRQPHEQERHRRGHLLLRKAD
jgi:ubiquinone/menaquinone biosynthesis C-methylase UbiE